MKSIASKRWPKREVEAFFDRWSPDMAYVLGYFASDGTMYKNKQGSCYLAFTSTDEELIVQVKRIMNVTNKIEIYNSPHNNYKTRYNLQIGGKFIFNRLLELGFVPNKSLVLKYPYVMPDKLVRDFVRGYFDGDGCVYIGRAKRKGRNGYINHLQWNLTCGNKLFLETMQSKLSELAFVGKGSLYFHSGAYRLAYSGRDVVKLYSFLYSFDNVPCLLRKRELLEKGVKSREDV
jgi:intein-encoded DNA endonuclease-like protein